METMAEYTELSPNQGTAKQGDDWGLPGALANVSIVVPVGPNETLWRSLLGDLIRAGSAAELLIVAAQPKPPDLNVLMADTKFSQNIQWIVSPPARAQQMNDGAKLSRRPFVWFLHADSRIGQSVIGELALSLDLHPQSIHYFDLDFGVDGLKLARLNAAGVRFRSRWLGLPFGDQGLCLSRDTFWRLGGFDEVAAYGEDHLLIWAARRERIPLQQVAATITTSARKYRAGGWLATTALHGWRTWRQAVPELFKLLWSRWQ